MHASTKHEHQVCSRSPIFMTRTSLQNNKSFWGKWHWDGPTDGCFNGYKFF